jgi:DNA-binding Lrp family transcriptional regulator
MEVAYLLLNCRQGKYKLVANALKKYDEIDDLHEVYGRFDIIAKVVCNDRHELKAFIQNKLQITEGIRDAETLLVSDLQSDE